VDFEVQNKLLKTSNYSFENLKLSTCRYPSPAVPSPNSSSESNQTYMLKTLLFAYSQKYFIFDGPTTAWWEELSSSEFLILPSLLTFASEMWELWAKAITQHSRPSWITGLQRQKWCFQVLQFLFHVNEVVFEPVLETKSCKLKIGMPFFSFPQYVSAAKAFVRLMWIFRLLVEVSVLFLTTMESVRLEHFFLPF